MTTAVKTKNCERSGHHPKEPKAADWIMVTGCIFGHIDVRYFCDVHWAARRFTDDHRPLCRICWEGKDGHKPGHIHYADDFIVEHV